jgi:tetratricopeptide (TPR) repeat protein
MSLSTALLLTAVGAALMALAAVVLWQARSRRNLRAQAARSAPVLGAVAPAPLPTGLPVLGDPAGRDSFGYPTQYVDKLGLRSLLWHGRFDELTRAFETYEDAFERDPTFEYWPIDAGEAFGSSEPELQRSLDAWASASPTSFAPYFARGNYSLARAYARRGGNSSKDTPDEDLAAMRDTLPLASVDLDRAISIRPKLVAAMRQKLQVLRLGSKRAEAEGVVARALAVCPSCFQIRVTHMFDLTPRWGGSYDAMLQFAKSSESAGARMKVLTGFVDSDRAELLQKDGKLDDARRLADGACSFGDQTDFLVQRGLIEEHQGDEAAALRDFERAVAMRPQLPDSLARRAESHLRRREWEAAGVDLLEALRIDPTEHVGRDIHANVVTGLVYATSEARKSGHRDEALRVIEIAAELDPLNREVQRWRSYSILGDDGANPDDAIRRLEAEHRSRPDDFKTLQELDYALSIKRDFTRIAALWTEYIAQHPTDGAAYLERSGTYYHLGQQALSQDDAAKACEYGMNEGCARAGTRH